MSDGRMQRKLEIDTLRGFACVLLVSFHVVGVSADMGLHLPADHWLQQFDGALAYLRMPLFSFLSGYVYAFRPYRPGQSDARGFIQGKMRRLLLPMLTVGTIFALMQNAIPGANQHVSNWWLLHIVPVAHFWFLEALFLVFLMVVALEHWRLLASPPRFAGVWALTVVAFVFLQVTPYFAANGAVYLMPFFLAGLACKRFDLHAVPARWLAAAVLALAGAGLRGQFFIRHLPDARFFHGGQPDGFHAPGCCQSLCAARAGHAAGHCRAHAGGAADRPFCAAQVLAAGRGAALSFWLRLDCRSCR
jgi:fucose 4-O-acetylase-like acetyltransferase